MTLSAPRGLERTFFDQLGAKCTCHSARVPRLARFLLAGLPKAPPSFLPVSDAEPGRKVGRNLACTCLRRKAVPSAEPHRLPRTKERVKALLVQLDLPRSALWYCKIAKTPSKSVAYIDCCCPAESEAEETLNEHERLIRPQTRLMVVHVRDIRSWTGGSSGKHGYLGIQQRR